MRELAARVDGLRAGDPIAPGARVVECDCTFDELERRLAVNPPVFVHDLLPIEDGINPRKTLWNRKVGYHHYLICRSELKLYEAIELFGIPISSGELAVDLGAAPGGWSYVLASRGMRVTAVDPGELDIRVRDHPLITHARTTAGRFLQEGTQGSAALLVNDMKMEPERSCALMNDFARILIPNGWALTTLKLPTNAVPSWPGIINKARSFLEQSYDVAGIRQLRSNRSEVCCALKRK